MSQHLFLRKSICWLTIFWLALALGCAHDNRDSTAPTSRAATLAPTSPNTSPTPANPVNTQDGNNSTAVVISKQANLRNGPSSSRAVLLKVEKDDALTLVSRERAGPWYNVIHVRSGKVGWINGNAIKLLETQAQSTIPQPPREAAPTSPAPKIERSSTPTTRSPVRSDTAPAGASARCRDGTYSFSQNRRGTCSHHGGVAEWL